MTLLLLLIAKFTLVTELPKLECLDAGKLRFLALGSQQEEKSAYCFDKTRSYFLSKSCHGKDCAAKTKKVCAVDPGRLKGQVGSPGFKLCEGAGGVPQILEFHDGEKWWSMDRCLFVSDGSYMDTGLMLKSRSECPLKKADKKGQ